LREVRTIVTHDECADGAASAILLHDALPDCDVMFADYGRDADSLPVREGMLFCDFSPPAARAQEYIEAGAFVLDHHRTAREVVSRFGDRGVYADEDESPGVSGALLAFREVWLPLRSESADRDFAEWFARAAGARDTWQTSSSIWRDGCVQQATLATFAQEYWLEIPLATLAREWTTRYAPIGDAVLARKRVRVLDSITHAHRFTTSTGLRVLTTNALAVVSDVAEELGEKVDLVVAFDVIVDGDAVVMRLSLRSHTDFDCGRFAQQHGGGGHRRSAGCAIALSGDAPHPFRFVEWLVDRSR